MSTLTDSSFAQVLGIIFLVGGAAALFRGKFLSIAIDGFVASPALLWMWGFINLLFGAAIVAFHSAQYSDWRVIITIVGWAGVLKGILLMLFPDLAKALYSKCNTPGILKIGGIIAIPLGLYLLYAGSGR